MLYICGLAGPFMHPDHIFLYRPQLPLFCYFLGNNQKKPGNKCWHLVVNEAGILFFRDGKEAGNKGQPFGAIFYGREYPMAKQFKDNAIEVHSI